MSEPHHSRISIMNFGKQLLGQDEKQSQMNNTWVPITPQKPILNGSNPGSNLSVNPMRRLNYQEFPVPGSDNRQEMLPLYHGPVQNLHLMGQTGQMGEHRKFGGNKADRNSVLNHIAASYNQARHYDSNGLNSNTLELLLNKNATNIASANRNLDVSNNIASRNPLLPKFHPQGSSSEVNHSYAGLQSNIHSPSGIVNKEANRLPIPSWNSELMGSSEVNYSYAGVQSNIHSASGIVNKEANGILIPTWNSELMGSSEMNDSYAGVYAGVQSNIHSASGIVNKEANGILIPSWNSELMGSSEMNDSYAGVYAGVQSNIHSASGIVNKEANGILITSWNSELMGSSEMNDSYAGVYAGVQSNIHSASGIVNKEANRLLIPSCNSQLMGSSKVNDSYAGVQSNIHSASGMVNKDANRLWIPSWNSELMGSNSDRCHNNDIHGTVSNQLKGMISDIPPGDSYLRYNLNHEPIPEADATNGFTNSLQLMPKTMDQLKFLDNQFCSRPTYTLAESTSQEKDKQEDLVSSTENEIQEYCDGLLQQIVDSSLAAFPTIYEDQKGSASNKCDQESDQAFDLNKTPEHKAPKRRKHRPKVIVEAKPKSKQNSATQKTQIKKTPHRKRKNVPKSAATPHADVIEESSDSTVATRKSCRKALNFDLEKSRFESQSIIVCQQEIHPIGTSLCQEISQADGHFKGGIRAKGFSENKRKRTENILQEKVCRSSRQIVSKDDSQKVRIEDNNGLQSRGDCFNSPGEQQEYSTMTDEISYQNLNESNISEMEGQMAVVPYKEHVDGQKALDQYKGDSSIVPYQESELAKKHRAKVVLDPETERMWKQLMGKEGCEGLEETDKEKEKWWEEERNVFRGRVDSFIARMHLVQGDRRFSKWKGSVVDSVVGVFLTQNVSDHLSSSAFMTLAARFPLKSKSSKGSYDVVTDTLVEEPELSIVNPADDTISYGGATLNQPSYYLDFKTPHHPRELWRDSETTRVNESLMKPNNQSSEEEFLSSQDSLDSSITHDKIITSSGSNSESDGLNSRCEPSMVQFLTSTNSLHVGKTTMFQDFYNRVNGVSLFEERTKDGKMQQAVHVEQSSRGVRNNSHSLHSSSNHPSSFGYLQKQPPAASSTHNQSHYPGTVSVHSKFQENSYRRIGIWEVGDSADKPTRMQYRNGTIGSPELPTMNPCGPLRKHSVLLQDTCQSRSHSNYNQLSPNHHLVDQKTIQSEGRQHAESLNTSQILCRGQENAINDYYNVPKHAEEGFDSEISTERRQVCSDNSRAEPKAQKQVYSPGLEDKERKLMVPKARKKKSNTEKKHAVDWDMLRKEVEEKETKKERSQEAMDSLDYEALRSASLKEIADTIVFRGMNHMLAERIKAFLNRLVEEHGSIDLEWLRHVPPDKAKDYLLSILGLGLKSVECVRLLTLHHLAFPVDTNVGRIAVRLGWVPLQPLPETLQIHHLQLYPTLESVQKYLWPRLCKLDQRTLYELHYQMITFGKVFCTKQNPNCNACPLRAECRHFASAFASARLALPGPQEKGIVSMAVPITAERNPLVNMNLVILPLPEDMIQEASQSVQCEPIIEEPATPEQQWTEALESDIEDFGMDPDEIPHIKIDGRELVKGVQHYIQQYKERDFSKAIVARNPEPASTPTQRLKTVSRLRTEHQVYELPDSHPLLEKMDKREPDDPSPYLLAIWSPGETANSTEPPERKCEPQDSTSTCFSQTIRGTLLIPCRTATRGSFPLNGTYFQVNEVFADDVSSKKPIDVPRAWIWNLPRRTVYFGSSVSSIFRGLTTQEIQHCFWRGFICVRGFDQQTRTPRPLERRLHEMTTERKQE